MSYTWLYLCNIENTKKLKATIALIGKEEEICNDFLQKLNACNYPIIYINNKETDRVESQIQTIKERNIQADIEIQSCYKEGCWEADVLFMFADGTDWTKDFFDEISIFTTQKVIALIAQGIDNWTSAYEKLESLKANLPNAKTVFAYCETDNFECSGNDKEAVLIVSEIFNDSGILNFINNN
ncbi:MAG TPA: hypothetical protein VLZ83_10875 [Edaphocola sp.]|nr:hypothetical protein [Edaphocola sp.]